MDIERAKGEILLTTLGVATNCALALAANRLLTEENAAMIVRDLKRLAALLEPLREGGPDALPSDLSVLVQGAALQIEGLGKSRPSED